MGELVLECVGVGVGGCAREVHVQGRIDAVKDKGFALGVEEEDILVFLGGSGTGVGILAAVVGEGKVIGAGRGGGWFHFGEGGGGVGGEGWFVVVYIAKGE